MPKYIGMYSIQIIHSKPNVGTPVKLTDTNEHRNTVTLGFSSKQRPSLSVGGHNKQGKSQFWRFQFFESGSRLLDATWPTNPPSRKPMDHDCEFQMWCNCDSKEPNKKHLHIKNSFIYEKSFRFDRDKIL